MKTLKLVTLFINILAIAPVLAYFGIGLLIQTSCSGQQSACSDVGLVLLPFSPYLVVAWVPILLGMVLSVIVLLKGKLNRKWLLITVSGLFLSAGIEIFFILDSRVANISQTEAINLIKDCHVGYVYPAHYGKDTGHDDPNIQLWTENDLKQTSEQNWEAIKQAVLSVQTKCNIHAPGILSD